MRIRGRKPDSDPDTERSDLAAQRGDPTAERSDVAARRGEPTDPDIEREAPATKRSALTGRRERREDTTPRQHPASERLRRLSDYFQAHGSLLEEMREEVDAATAPLADLLERHDHTTERVLENLEQRLQPLNDYAENEEENLARLQGDMQSREMAHLAGSFEQYVEQQREHIDETHQRIAEQRTPIARYGDDHRDAVEAALARFDTDIAALERNLTEQSRVMIRMRDAIKSETFTAACDFLEAREATLAQLADEGVTDPAQIGATLHGLRESLTGGGSGLAADYLAELVEVTDLADERLGSVRNEIATRRPRPLLSPGDPAQHEDRGPDADMETDEQDTA